MSKREEPQIPENNNDKRDFKTEYEELFGSLELLRENHNFEVDEDGGRFEKFSLLKRTGTPILSNHSI